MYVCIEMYPHDVPSTHYVHTSHTCPHDEVCSYCLKYVRVLSPRKLSVLVQRLGSVIPTEMKASILPIVHVYASCSMAISLVGPLLLVCYPTPNGVNMCMLIPYIHIGLVQSMPTLFRPSTLIIGHVTKFSIRGPSVTGSR